MKKLVLISPSKSYKNSFLDFVADVKATGYETYKLYKKSEDNFEEYLEGLHNESQFSHDNLWGPQSSFWLIDDKNMVVGIIRIRHSKDNKYIEKLGNIGYEIKSTCRNLGYGSKILELGLFEAKKLGLKEVLLTCYSSNIGSIKIIEKLNGCYVKSFIDSDNNKMIKQFKILT